MGWYRLNRLPPPIRCESIRQPMLASSMPNHVRVPEKIILVHSSNELCTCTTTLLIALCSHKITHAQHWWALNSFQQTY